jgi:hypothetical protein
VLLPLRNSSTCCWRGQSLLLLLLLQLLTESRWDSI